MRTKPWPGSLHPRDAMTLDYQPQSKSRRFHFFHLPAYTGCLVAKSMIFLVEHSTVKLANKLYHNTRLIWSLHYFLGWSLYLL
jgi:hypothetical protein